MNDTYLDNSATTRVDEAVAQAALAMMTENYGNPSSLHSRGLRAEQALTRAREAVARSLGARPDEITFTSGGTEANNLALLGVMQRGHRMGGRVVTTAAEHSSVLAAVRELERRGCEAVLVNPQADGNLCPAALLDAVNERTALVSVMLVNNETGAIFPVREIFSAVKRKNPACICHCDAVQAYGKLPLRVQELGADLLTVSGHKVHAPKGVGALFIRKGLTIAQRQFGGKQERGVRPGTESAPLIAALGCAAQQLEPSALHAHCAALKERLLSGVRALCGVQVNSPEDGLPAVVSLSVEGVRSETLLHVLEERGVYVSSGSACARGEKSHVLRAMGLPESLIDGAVRVSFSKYSTPDDVDALLAALGDGITRLRK